MNIIIIVSSSGAGGSNSRAIQSLHFTDYMLPIMQQSECVSIRGSTTRRMGGKLSPTCVLGPQKQTGPDREQRKVLTHSGKTSP